MFGPNYPGVQPIRRNPFTSWWQNSIHTCVLSASFTVIYVHGNSMAYQGWGKNWIGNESPGPPPCLHSSWALNTCFFFFLHCCLTSTEARRLIRDGDRVGKGRESEGSTAETARKRPERPWTAAGTMEVWRRCAPAIAQRLVHCAIAVSTAVLGQSQRQCPLHCCWRTTWTTRSKRGPSCSAQLHLPTHDLFWANLRVQLHLPPLRSLDLLISPGTLEHTLALCSGAPFW